MSCFFCQVRVHHLPGDVMAQGCTMGKRQADRGSVMRFAVFYWETLGLGSCMDVNLTCSTYLNIVADQVHHFMVFPHGSRLFYAG